MNMSTTDDTLPNVQMYICTNLRIYIVMYKSKFRRKCLGVIIIVLEALPKAGNWIVVSS